MTPLDLSAVHGIAQLLGRGVYIAVADRLLQRVSGGHVVVVGEPAAAAAAALRLHQQAGHVTLAFRESGRSADIPRRVRTDLRRHASIRTLYRTELAWAVGIDQLEAVILRHMPSGRIEATLFPYTTLFRFDRKSVV